MGWDENWAATQGVGKLPRNVLNQLRAALAERCAVMVSPPTLPAVLSAGKLPGAAWFATFQTAISAMIPVSSTSWNYWVKHNVGAPRKGKWDGAAWPERDVPAIDRWLMAGMLTAIGDESRIAAPTVGKLCASWAWQQKRMLDQLRWYGLLVKDDTTNCRYKAGDSMVNYATAAAAHDAMEWTLISSPPGWTSTNGIRNGCWQAFFSSPTYFKTSIKWKWSWAWTGIASAEYDTYARPRELTGGPLFGMDTVDVANYVQNNIVAPSTGYEYGDSHSETPTFYNSIYSRVTTSYYGLFVVAKLDVTGGFEYRNWEVTA